MYLNYLPLTLRSEFKTRKVKDKYFGIFGIVSILYLEKAKEKEVFLIFETQTQTNSYTISFI